MSKAAVSGRLGLPCRSIGQGWRGNRVRLLQMGLSSCPASDAGLRAPSIFLVAPLPPAPARQICHSHRAPDQSAQHGRDCPEPSQAGTFVRGLLSCWSWILFLPDQDMSWVLPGCSDFPSLYSKFLRVFFSQWL